MGPPQPDVAVTRLSRLKARARSRRAARLSVAVRDLCEFFHVVGVACTMQSLASIVVTLRQSAQYCRSHFGRFFVFFQLFLFLYGPGTTTMSSPQWAISTRCNCRPISVRRTTPSTFESRSPHLHRHCHPHQRLQLSPRRHHLVDSHRCSPRQTAARASANATALDRGAITWARRGGAVTARSTRPLRPRPKRLVRRPRLQQRDPASHCRPLPQRFARA